ncbi:signaling lymphocytic activation molecule-like [Platysternon megacephalum]|uniref:Signaling lymphocytic activation molecule-like n=1 Tax=Platysternon megacephalum TaxID=55544 RepID=A0A4D9EBV7_9SAUR|nr:signaling lymphocytic activation molecule-like [Platysternon megacephalum]
MVSGKGTQDPDEFTGASKYNKKLGSGLPNITQKAIQSGSGLQLSQNLAITYAGPLEKQEAWQFRCIWFWGSSLGPSLWLNRAPSCMVSIQGALLTHCTPFKSWAETQSLF